MSYLDQFSITFTSLSLGVHAFEFDLDERFFEDFEEDEISKAGIRVFVSLEKQERMLVLSFDIKGTVNIMCDRCLDQFDQAVEGEERLIVKFGDSYHEESEEVVVIPESVHKLNVSQYIYEFINLLLPIKRVHLNDEEGMSRCNPEIVDRFAKLENDEKTDPRWDALRMLQNSK